ncbi:PLP-dependent lyase/thiolase [Patescibacteria group bacterium]|nr:PLP-dependent lyase/thiolase [Patescibacteria group bacterium]MBU1721764.1 PLP-dependent lyase/thiolase [Patescibacteria group bacterium]MBU1901397.1 PLP-dependent lyase/thiolase [Patescibacteria group bacterium]
MKTVQKQYPFLARTIGVKDLWLKREDQHSYGSHKGRSIPLMIKEYYKRKNVGHFVISSSGNAALAAAITVENHNKNNPEKPISLEILVGKNITKHKLTRLQAYISDSIHISQVDNPKQMAFQKDKKGEAVSLRQSTDDTALRGYYSLGQELSKIPDLQAIFIPTSSGTTAQGIAEVFTDMNHVPQIHIVQTSACSPIASIFDTDVEPTSTTVAPAICDRVAHRKLSVISAINQTHGSGWVVTNKEIKDMITLVKRTTKMTLSPNGILGLVGIKKAVQAGWTWDGAVVCIVTGE